MEKNNFYKFICAVIVELFLFLLISKLVSFFMFNSRMNAGSKILLAPFIFFKEIYSNSSLIESYFSLPILILNLVIIIVIAIVFIKITRRY